MFSRIAPNTPTKVQDHFRVVDNTRRESLPFVGTNIHCPVMLVTSKRSAHLSVASSGTTQHALDLANPLRGVARGHGTDEEEEDQSGSAEDDELALGGVGVAVLGPRAASLAGVLAHLVTTELVVHKADQGEGVTEELEAGDRGLPEHHGGSHQEDILQDTAQGHDQRGGLADQEDDGYVQQEGNHGVGKEDPDADTVDVVHGETGNLQEQSNASVHNGADGGEVIQRDHGVHLVLSGAEQALHHNQTGSLEDDTAELEQETDHDELDLTEGGNNDTDDDDRNVREGLVVDWGHAHTPGSQEDSDGGSSLQKVRLSATLEIHSKTREMNIPSASE